MAKLLPSSTFQAACLICLMAPVLTGCGASSDVPPDAFARRSGPRIRKVARPTTASTRADISQTAIDTSPNATRLSRQPQRQIVNVKQTAATTVRATTWKPRVNARPWKFIVLHHSANDRGNVESINRVHSQRKDKQGNPWLGIGYHFVIGNGNGLSDGAVEPTFRWNKQLQGAHAGVSRYNELGVGICLIGDFDKTPPTAKQLDATRRLISFLTDQYDITVKNIVGHGDVRKTACPGRLFPMRAVTHGATTKSASEPQSQRTAGIPNVKVEG